jgi:hypothetical protein
MADRRRKALMNLSFPLIFFGFLLALFATKYGFSPPQFCGAVTRHLLLPSSALRVTFIPNGQRGSPAAPGV